MQQWPQQFTPPGSPATPNQFGRLEVHTGFFFLAWILFFVSTGITINGQLTPRPWGLSYWDLPPGIYRVRVHFNYLFGPTGGAERQVQIYPGHTTRLKYEAPFFMFMPGTLYEQQATPLLPR